MLAVSVFSWDEISAKLKQYPELVRKHYPHLWERVRTETHKTAFGLGVLIGGILESAFVLNHLNPKSEHHWRTFRELSKLAVAEAKKIGVSTELESLLDSLKSRRLEKRFFVVEYPRCAAAIKGVHGAQAEEYFNLALALQDCLMGVGDLKLGLKAGNPDLLEIGRNRFSNSCGRIRTLLPALEVGASVKLAILETADSLTKTEYSSNKAINSAAKKIQRVIELVWCTA